jgi:hypothetical protein
VPSTTNVCNLVSNPRTTLEYLKPTSNKPNSNQDPLPTAIDTSITSTNRRTTDTKHNEEKHKEIHYLGFTLHKKSHRFLMLPTTCHGPKSQAKQDFLQTTILNENGLFGIVQKNRRNQRTKRENAKGQSEMVDRSQGVQLDLVYSFSTKISIAWTTCLVFVYQMVESNFFFLTNNLNVKSSIFFQFCDVVEVVIIRPPYIRARAFFCVHCTHLRNLRFTYFRAHVT